jgi:hypothetical protein
MRMQGASVMLSLRRHARCCPNFGRSIIFEVGKYLLIWVIGSGDWMALNTACHATFCRRLPRCLLPPPYCRRLPCCLLPMPAMLPVAPASHAASCPRQPCCQLPPPAMHPVDAVCHASYCHRLPCFLLPPPVAIYVSPKANVGLFAGASSSSGQAGAGAGAEPAAGEAGMVGRRGSGRAAKWLEAPKVGEGCGEEGLGREGMRVRVSVQRVHGACAQMARGSDGKRVGEHNMLLQPLFSPCSTHESSGVPAGAHE